MPSSRRTRKVISRKDSFQFIIAGISGESYKTFDFLDPYEFIFKFVKTLDPHDPSCPVKNIPDRPYVRELIRIWLEEHNLLLVKSRQMMATWLFCALNLWLAMTQNGQYIFFISKKEDDAGYSTQLSLLSRARFIFEHLPEDMQIKMKQSAAPATMSFPNKNSTIHGVSQDSDATRQYTASSIMFDEMAFMEHAEQCFASIKPTLDGPKHKIKIKTNGPETITLAIPKFTGVSTPNGKRNLFYKIAHDRQE